MGGKKSFDFAVVTMKTIISFNVRDKSISNLFDLKPREDNMQLVSLKLLIVS